MKLKLSFFLSFFFLSLSATAEFDELRDAVINNDIDEVEKLIAEINPNWQTELENGRTLAEDLFANCNNEEIAHLLIKAGAHRAVPMAFLYDFEQYVESEANLQQQAPQRATYPHLPQITSLRNVFTILFLAVTGFASR